MATLTELHAKLHLVDLQIILVVLVQVWLADCLEIYCTLISGHGNRDCGRPYGPPSARCVLPTTDTLTSSRENNPEYAEVSIVLLSRWSTTLMSLAPMVSHRQVLQFTTRPSMLRNLCTPVFGKTKFISDQTKHRPM